jgi:hypothetical protein
MWADTLTIKFMTMPVDSHQVKISRNLGRWLNTGTYDIGSNKSCILMPTTLSDTSAPNACGFNFYLTTENPFPIIAYSMGIPLDNGIIHFCGLRDAGIHPKLWAEKFKIKNYIYFEIKFLE